ncbi:MAG: DUF1722 domain-containing protein [Nitrospiraceae bacterium]|nr:MAG: DUF1722 domain-containing protein [Nitrospiraceae bacterium]
MQEKVKLGISSCLLGERVRYDGGHKLDHFMKDTLGLFIEWVPVCPEVESGLPVPREAMRLVGDPEAPRLVKSRSGNDYTDSMVTWAKRKLAEIEKEDLCGFIFKSKSPSSGMRGVKVYGPSGIPSRAGVGIFARAFMEKFPRTPVEDEGRLCDPGLRENFIERIFVCKRWKEFTQKGTVRDLIEFHTDHKLLVLSHSPGHYSALGNLVANSRKYKSQVLQEEYLSLLMEGLKLIATVRKNTNVLHHMMGYFKKQLQSEEKKEMLEVIEEYHKGFIPLIVPVTLIRHYVRKYDGAYLKRQYYLNPHPAELMLRNHV